MKAFARRCGVTESTVRAFGYRYLAELLSNPDASGRAAEATKFPALLPDL